MVMFYLLVRMYFTSLVLTTHGKQLFLVNIITIVSKYF